MLLQRGAERDLVVLDDEDDGEFLYCGEVRALVRRGRLGGAVAHPREGDPRLLPQLEAQRDPRHHGHDVAHVRDRL